MMIQTIHYPSRKRGLSLTALIDVVFILLMFFMVSTQFTKWQAFTLQNEAKGTAAGKQIVVHLSLSAKGEVSAFKEQELHLKTQHFSQLSTQSLAFIAPQQAVFLHPQAHTQLSTLVAALESLQRNGVPQIRLGSTHPAP